MCGLAQVIQHIHQQQTRTHTSTHTHLLRKSGRVDAVELSEAVLQHTKPHRALHHIHALQLEVVHGVEAGDASGAGLSQSQELLRCRGDGLAWRVISEERGLEEHHNKREEVDLFFAKWSDAKTLLVIFCVIKCNSHKVDPQIYYDECKLALQMEHFLNLSDLFHIFVR